MARGSLVTAHEGLERGLASVPGHNPPASAEMGVQSAVLYRDYPFSGSLPLDSSVFKELHGI